MTKTYPGAAAPAVNDVSLDVEQGRFLALVGGSGSGKTTLLKIVNRLIEADAGEVRVFDAPVSAEPGYALRRKIGYVIQGVGLFPHISVAENLAVTPRLLGWTPERIDARVRELLELVELPVDEFAARMPDALSGGQRQRVGFARALAARPSLMLMDEPFGALDPLTRDTIANMYRRLHDKLGLTTVMVTHDMMEALLLAERIVVMREGRIVAHGSPRELLATAADPYVVELLSMPRQNAERVHALIEQARGHG